MILYAEASPRTTKTPIFDSEHIDNRIRRQLLGSYRMMRRAGMTSSLARMMLLCVFMYGATTGRSGARADEQVEL